MNTFSFVWQQLNFRVLLSELVKMSGHLNILYPITCELDHVFKMARHLSIWLKLASVPGVGKTDIVGYNLSCPDIKCECENFIFVGNKGKNTVWLGGDSSCPPAIYHQTNQLLN